MAAVTLLAKLGSSASRLQIEPALRSGAPRHLPLAFALSVWLSPALLLGLSIFTIATTTVLLSLWMEKLPTDWQLMLSRRTTDGVIDSVVRHGKLPSKSRSFPKWHYRFHFSLPEGRQVNGVSIASTDVLKVGDQVVVEYHPQRPWANRIQGMRSPDGDFVRLGVMLLPFCIALIVHSLFHSNFLHKLFAYGQLGSATVTHCQLGKNRPWEIELNGWRCRLPHRVHEVSLLEFQQIAVAKHRAEFDAQGRYQGTRRFRLFHLGFAALAGAFFSTIVGLFFSTFFWGEFSLQLITICAICGSLLGGTIEAQSRILLRSGVKKSLDDLPEVFRQRVCYLQLNQPGQSESVRFATRLDLQGDASDAGLRPVLYLLDRPRSAKLVQQLGLAHSSLPSGGVELIASLPMKQLLIAVLLSVVSVVWLVNVVF